MILEKQKWSEFCQKTTSVAVVGLMGEWMTIYACLQQAIKNFDFVYVIGDGVTERAKNEFDKFSSDYYLQAQGKLLFEDLDNVDPWPWLVFPYYPRDEGINSIDRIPTKSWSKAGFKRFNLARSKFPNSLLFSVHSDVVVFSDSKKRLIQRMSGIENPFFDSEWFSMVSAYDLDTVAAILDPISTPGNLIPHRDLKQRTVYDYPGDWGLMGYYASSLLSVGPDPQGPSAECFYPWSRKTQCEKKGFDVNEPHAVHFEWLREKNINKDYSDVNWKTIRLSSLSTIDKKFTVEKDTNLINSLEDIKNNCYFPVNFKLDEKCILRIEEK